MRFADVLAVRLSWTGRFALAASLALACIIGLRVMQRTIDPAGNLAGGPAGPGASLAFASILPPEAEQLLLDGVFAANDNSAFSSAMQTREMTYSDVLSELRLIEEAMGG